MRVKTIDINEIRIVLVDKFQDLTHEQSNIYEWRGYLFYMLQALEAEAMDIDQSHLE